MSLEGVVGNNINNVILLLSVGIAALGILIGVVIAMQKGRKGENSPKEKRGAGNTDAGYWEWIKDGAEYAIPIWGQWKLINRLREKEGSVPHRSESLAKAVNDLQKQMTVVMGELEAIKSRLATSGIPYKGQQKREEAKSEEESDHGDQIETQSGFWNHFKEKAQYAVPIWGQWKLIRHLREKEGTAPEQ